jgi:type II secretory pathway pseudopilin PulG
MFFRLAKNRSGMSLVEVIVAIGILGVGGTSVIMMLISSLRGAEAGSERAAAGLLVSQGYEAVRSIGNGSFNSLVNGTYGLDETGNIWNLVGTPDVHGLYTRRVVIADVYRDGNGNIAPAGTLDIHTKKITTTVDWSFQGQAKSVEAVDYFTNWDRRDLFSDLAGDWSAGTLTDTEVTTAEDGEVALLALGVDLSFLSSYNAPGAANGGDLELVGSTAFFVRPGSADDELVALDVSDPNNPVLMDSLNLGADGNAVAISGNYAYIATSSNYAEMLVVDISNPANLVLQAGLDLIDLPGNADALDVSVVGDRAYLTRTISAANDFVVVDITDPHYPVMLGSYMVGKNVYSVEVDGNYAFLATGTNNSREFFAMNISNPASITLASSIGFPGSQDAFEVVLDRTNHRAFVGRNNATSALYAVDIANPAAMSILGFINLNGTCRGLDLQGNFLYAAITGSAPDVAVIDVTNPAAMVISDSHNVNVGYGMNVRYSNGYAYLTTSDDSAELVVLGAVAGGMYLTSGSFVSPVLDAGSSANWNTLEWSEDLSCGGGDLQIQIRTADAPGNLASALWQGPDGEDLDETDFYTDPLGQAIPVGHNGDRYFQYRALLTGPGTCTPLLKDFRATYTPY